MQKKKEKKDWVLSITGEADVPFKGETVSLLYVLHSILLPLHAIYDSSDTLTKLWSSDQLLFTSLIFSVRIIKGKSYFLTFFGKLYWNITIWVTGNPVHDQNNCFVVLDKYFQLP